MSSIPKKGVAFRVTFPILDSGSTPTSITAPDSQISKDQGAFTACVNEAIQIGTSGWYYLDLTAAEMTADTVSIQVNHGTASVPPAVLEFYPDEGRILSDILTAVSGLNTAQLQLIYDLAVLINARTQLITGGPVSIVSPVAQTGGNITALRADTWVIPFSAIGSLVGIDELIFTVKSTAGTPDETAQLLISSADGLEVLAGSAAGNASLGSISITDAATGAGTITVAASATSELTARGSCVYAFKRIDGGVATTLARGTFIVTQATVEQTS